MRNLKKLFAVVMIVAMLASMMVPALAAGVEYDDEAGILQDLNLFQGYGAGDLGLEDDLTREQGLALMLRVMGLEEEVKAMTEEEIAEGLAKVTDPETITATWAKPYVAYAVLNGLTNGIDASTLPNVKFAGQLKMNGQEFINFILKGMGYTVAWDDVLAKASEVEMLSAGEAVTFGTIKEMVRDQAVAIMYNALTGVTSEGITLAQALVDAGAVDADKMIEYGFIEEEEVVVEPVEITAEASTTNLIQINVEFNAPVDKDSAQDKDNYDIKKVKIADAALQDDGVTVVLTLDWDSARDQQAVVDLTIKGVKDVDGEEIDEFTIEDIEFLDTTIPTVIDASVVGKDTLKVVFSEPMKGTKPADKTPSELAKKDFVVNGGKLYVREVKLQNNYTEALVKLYSDLKEGELTLQVKSGSEDFAGFGVIGKTFTLEVVEDDEAPVVIGYEKAKRSEVTLIWNEDIDQNYKDSEVRDFFYHTNSKNAVEDVEIDGNKTTLKFHKDFRLPNGTAYVYVMKEAVKDLWDNKNAQEMIQVDIEIDSTPPEVDKVEAEEQNKIVITFTEDLAEGSDDKDNFTILDDKGDEVKNIIKNMSLDGKKITINLKKNLSGDYSIVIKGVEDDSDNKIVKVTVPFNVGDTIPPKHGDFTAILYNGSKEGQMLKVNFKDVMATEGKYSVTDIEKYVILNSGSIDDEEMKLEDLDGVEITLVDENKAIEIIIPSEEDVDEAKKDNHLNLSKGMYILVSRVEDAAENKMTVMAHPVEIDTLETIDIKSAKATALDTIEITFKDNVSKFEADDILFELADGSFLDADEDIAGVTTKLNSDGNTVAVFTLDRDLLAYDVKLEGNEVSVWVDPNKDGESDSTNQYGLTLTLYGKDEPAFAVTDAVAPKLYDDGSKTIDFAEADADAFVGDKLKVNKVTVAGNVYNFTATIFFTEEINVVSEALAGSDFVITVDGDKLVNGVDYWVIDSGKATDGDKNIGFITFAIVGEDNEDDEIFELIGDLEIDRVEEPQYVTDVNDNKIAKFDTIELDDLELEVLYSK